VHLSTDPDMEMECEAARYRAECGIDELELDLQMELLALTQESDTLKMQVDILKAQGFVEPAGLSGIKAEFQNVRTCRD